MITTAKRFAAVVLGIVLAGTVVDATATFLPMNPVAALVAYAKNELWSDAQTLSADEASLRNERILAELERLDGHPWAGVYRTRGKWPNVLRIAPDAGFTFYHGSWCGNCSRWVGLGRVLSVDGLNLTLEIELGAEIGKDEWSTLPHALEPMLHLVRWGDLLFAVPPWRMESFCAEASDGLSFPWSHPFRYVGSAEWPGHDKAHRPESRPTVPKAYEHLLLSKPIAANVASLVEWRPRSDSESDDYPAYDAAYSIDVGSDDGVAVGMRFWPESGFLIGTGRVQQVAARSSEVVFLVYEDDLSLRERLVGVHVTTDRPTE